jgi:hypothetical protein
MDESALFRSGLPGTVRDFKGNQGIMRYDTWVPPMTEPIVASEIPNDHGNRPGMGSVKGSRALRGVVANITEFNSNRVPSVSQGILRDLKDSHVERFRLSPWEAWSWNARSHGNAGE